MFTQEQIYLTGTELGCGA